MPAFGQDNLPETDNYTREVWPGVGLLALWRRLQPGGSRTHGSF